MVLFPDSPAPKNQILHSLDINLYTEAKQWNTTQTRIDLYWHKERLNNVTKACVIKKIVTILRFYYYTIYLNKIFIQCSHIIQTTFCLHKWLLKFPAWSALLSQDNIIIETTPYGASSVHLKIKINDVVDVYQYEESETFIDWLCLPNKKLPPSEIPRVKSGHVWTYIILNSNTSYLDNT